MSPLLRRQGPSQWERAAKGMPLLEHLRELRSRMFKASLGLAVGFGIGMWLAVPALTILEKPYCSRFSAVEKCQFVILSPPDYFLLKLKIALYIALLISSPVWLYQLWAFIAPGLHKHERRWTYLFVVVATPLFVAGSVLAYLVVDKGLDFLLPSGDATNVAAQLEITRYIDFVTGLLLVFGVAFEFPLVVVMLNFAGLVSARRLLGWWRPAVFLMFLFSAIVTPTPDPFGMTALAVPMCLFYFAAVGVAFIHDRRKARSDELGGLSDDETSPIGEPTAVEPSTNVSGAVPLDSRYDDAP